jgi:hypothetical protein
MFNDKNNPVIDVEVTLEAQIAGWKKQYGDDRIYDLTPDNDGFDEELAGVIIICRHPERKDLSRLAKGLSGDSLKALTNLVYDCLLYPDRTKIEALLTKKPGLAISIGGALQKMAGVMIDFLPKKL